MKKTAFLIFLLLFVIFYISGNEQDLSDVEKMELYNKEKVNLVVREEFDVMYPSNIKSFEFYKGGEQITLDDFIKISNDPLLIRNQKKLNQVKIAGFTSVGILGAVTLGFLIPSTVFVVSMTNNAAIDDVHIPLL